MGNSIKKAIIFVWIWQLLLIIPLSDWPSLSQGLDRVRDALSYRVGTSSRGYCSRAELMWSWWTGPVSPMPRQVNSSDRSHLPWFGHTLPTLWWPLMTVRSGKFEKWVALSFSGYYPIRPVPMFACCRSQANTEVSDSLYSKYPFYYIFFRGIRKYMG